MKDSNQLSKAPLNLLVNPKTARKGKPWEIDIADLLDIFLKQIIAKNNPDLRLCGTAALSSAVLYRFKVETLFYFEKLKVKRPRISRSGPPSIIVLPFRYELYSTSIDDLIINLEKILEDVSRQDIERKYKSSQLIPDSEPDFDKYVVKFDELAKDFKTELITKLSDNDKMLFSELIKDKSAIEKARSFLLLLFVAVDDVVTLEQLESPDSLDSDIIITRVLR
uniref:Chromosome segregation and condensation protein (ScpA) n=1 Tax=uncultured marine thaumarchaeote KM3_46_H07 TaxID=1456163 RepID=A0A075H6B0_9ARCH|nr:chromosome segregation and condensation protein (scpA) [uncultured marine thaumarchaeote KM3_46_H07]